MASPDGVDCFVEDCFRVYVSCDGGLDCKYGEVEGAFCGGEVVFGDEEIGHV